MTLFDGPATHDHLYIKLAGSKSVASMPLCEAFTRLSNVTFDYKQSNATTVVLIERKENGKSTKYAKSDFMTWLQKDIYNDKQKIVDFVIQPEGETQTHEVTTFLEQQ